MEKHVPNGPAATWNLHDAEKLSRLRVKAYQPIRLRACLNEPESIAGIDGHAVGPGVFSAWYGPFLHIPP